MKVTGSTEMVQAKHWWWYA